MVETKEFSSYINYLDDDWKWTNPTLHCLELRTCTEWIKCAKYYNQRFDAILLIDLITKPHVPLWRREVKNRN